jgi:hypothetical protein
MEVPGGWHEMEWSANINDRRLLLMYEKTLKLNFNYLQFISFFSRFKVLHAGFPLSEEFSFLHNHSLHSSKVSKSDAIVEGVFLGSELGVHTVELPHPSFKKAFDWCHFVGLSFSVPVLDSPHSSKATRLQNKIIKNRKTYK